MPRKLYPVVVHREPGTDYWASFIDFHVNVAGATVEECLAEAEEAVNLDVEHLLSTGKSLPAPTPVEAIAEEDRAGAALVSLVPVTVPGRAKRVQITLDEDLVEAIDAISSNRSGFLAEAAREKLRQR